MQKLKLMLAAAVVLGAGLVATTNFAAAQEYVGTAPDCVAPPAPPPQWYTTTYPNYFVADWGPFFRRHSYRYGPVLVCAATATPPVILSSKY
jgi:hypothetical protein